MAQRKSGHGGARPGSGPPPLPLSEVRRNKLVLFLTDGELARLRKAAGQGRPSTFAREIVFRVLARRRK